MRSKRGRIKSLLQTLNLYMKIYDDRRQKSCQTRISASTMEGIRRYRQTVKCIWK